VDGRRDEEWCMCGDCRRKARAGGIPFTNIDQDFAYVAV
jgi:hypothetical protein